MTRAERMVAFPMGCPVRLIGRPNYVGRVVGWSRKYDAVYVVRTGSKSGAGMLGATHLWERCDGVRVAGQAVESVEEHW